MFSDLLYNIHSSTQILKKNAYHITQGKYAEIAQREMKNNYRRVPQHIIPENILLKALNKSKDVYMNSNEFQAG